MNGRLLVCCLGQVSDEMILVLQNVELISFEMFSLDIASTWWRRKHLITKTHARDKKRDFRSALLHSSFSVLQKECEVDDVARFSFWTYDFFSRKSCSHIDDVLRVLWEPLDHRRLFLFYCSYYVIFLFTCRINFFNG